MTGDYFVYALMTLNAGAAVTYGWQGHWIKAFYWCCVIGLNFALVKMK